MPSSPELPERPDRLPDEPHPPVRSRRRIPVVGGVLGVLVVGALVVLAFVSGPWLSTKVAAPPTKVTATPSPQVAAAPLAENRKALINLTSQLLQERKKKVDPKALAQLAQRRKTALLAALKDDPEAVLLAALPTKAGDSFPEDVKPLLEREETAAGTVRHMLGHDFDNGAAEEFYFLQTADKEKPLLRLYFPKKPAVRTGDAFKGTGVRIDDAFVVKQSGIPTTSRPDGTGDVAGAVAGATSGEQRTVALISNFTDKTSLCTPAQINTMLFGARDSVDAYYRQSSFGKVSFSGDVFGPYTINYPSSSTAWTSWGRAIDDAATAAAVDLSQYERILYVLPRNGTPYGGVSELGPAAPTDTTGPSRSWVFQCSTFYSLAHELGHALSMMHASTLDHPYGDLTDVMGGGRDPLWTHNNAPHKVAMQWVPPERVQTVTTSGTYTISVLEAEASGTIQALKFPKLDTDESYYIGYRRLPVPSTSYGYTQNRERTSVHRWGDRDDWDTYLLAALADGQEYTDAANAITIRQVSHNETTATVEVSLPTRAECIRALHDLTVTPLNHIGPPGQPQVYSVTIKNNDSAGCAHKTFWLTNSNPAEGWSSAFANAFFTLGPGTESTTTLTVTPPSTAADATYALVVGAKNFNNLSENVNVWVAFNVVSEQVATIPGDTNSDCAVNLADLTNVRNNFGKTPSATIKGDANGDGAINLADLTLVRNNFGKTCPSS